MMIRSLLCFTCFIFSGASIAQQNSSRSLSQPISGDYYQTFFHDGHAVININEMGLRNVTHGATATSLWSGPYWPIHQGLIAARYGDATFPKSKIFSTNYAAVQNAPSDSYVEHDNIKSLSPAEKYDLLIGDTNWTLTKAMWQQGVAVNDTMGLVPTWEGICHGWAAAVSMGVQEPQHSVTALDVTGKYKIEFYPDDVAALESYLWARSSPPIILVGHRCEQSPVIDNSFGRPTNPFCLDSNPMTWHTIVVNKLGIERRSFIMDSNPGNEVWNYPVAGYDYSYFNPQTLESSHSLADSIVSVEVFTSDRFKRFRSANTRYVVGIMMDVFHPSLVNPQVGANNGKVPHTDSFIYDLELDENFDIVGGEWYEQKVRPKFLWTYNSGAKATTRDDSSLPDRWDLTTALPEVFATQAKKASLSGVVLSKVANALLDQSL